MSLPENPPDLLNLRAIQTEVGSAAPDNPGVEDALSAASTPSPRAQEGFVNGEVIKIKGNRKRKCGHFFSYEFDSLVDSLSFHGTGTEISTDILQSVQVKIRNHTAINYYGLLYQFPGCLLWYFPVILLLWTLLFALLLGILECDRHVQGHMFSPDCSLTSAEYYHKLCVQRDVDALFRYHIHWQMVFACFLGFMVNFVVSPLFLIIIIPRCIWCSLHKLLLELIETELSSSYVLVYIQHQMESRYLAYVPIFARSPCIYFIEYDLKPCQEHLTVSDSVWHFLISYMDRLITGKLHTCMLRDRRHLVVDDHICVCQYVEHRRAHPLYCFCRICLRPYRSADDAEVHEEML